MLDEQARQTETKEVMANSRFVGHTACPFCGSSDAGALYEDGTARCYSEGCGGKWNWTEMTVHEKPKSDDQLPFDTTRGIPKRGIRALTTQFWQYGWSKERRCHVAEWCDERGYPVAQKHRYVDKGFSWTGDRSSACSLYGEWLWREGGKMLVITEGEIDALSVSQAQSNRYPVVSLPDGASSAVEAVKRSLSWVESFDAVVLMFDMDEPGRNAAQKVANLLTPGKARIAVLPEGAKDANDLLVQRGEKAVKDAIWSAKAWKPEGIVTGREIWDRVVEEQEPPLVEWPFPGTQEKTRGIHQGEIILIAAGVGAGKSTLVRTLELDFAQRGRKVGILPLEESVGQTARGVLALSAGINVHTSDLDKDKEETLLKPEFDSLQDRFVFCEDEGMREEGWVFDRLRYLALGCGCDIVVVDPLTVVIGAQSVNDDRKFADLLVTRLESLVKRTGVSVIVTMHLRKLREGTPHEEGHRVTMSDVRGSGLIAALSHQVIGYERNQQGEDPTESTIRVLKCRRTGRTGEADKLTYIEETGKLMPKDDVEEYVEML